VGKAGGRGAHIELDVGKALANTGSRVADDTDALDLAGVLAEDAPQAFLDV